MGPHAPGAPMGSPQKYFQKIPKIAEKAYTPPTSLNIIFYDVEPRLKVYIPAFQPPGHSSDGLGLY